MLRELFFIQFLCFTCAQFMSDKWSNYIFCAETIIASSMQIAVFNCKVGFFLWHNVQKKTSRASTVKFLFLNPLNSLLYEIYIKL